MDKWAEENRLTFSSSKTLNIIFKNKWETNKNHNKKPNYTLQGKSPVPGDDLKQQIWRGATYWHTKSQTNQSPNVIDVVSGKTWRHQKNCTLQYGDKRLTIAAIYIVRLPRKAKNWTAYTGKILEYARDSSGYDQ